MKRELRGGFTTGACAAAAAKAAALMLVGNAVAEVDIPFPDGCREIFPIFASRAEGKEARAGVIKDAGDDPDITHGAEIVAAVTILATPVPGGLIIKGGPGVGLVTKPGLILPPGEAAINPVPRMMIRAALADVFPALGHSDTPALEITVSVPRGEELARKTLNARLGIVGGISILGTTGRVVPVSAEAWAATIVSSLKVARAMGRGEVVLSAGRASERAHEKTYALPPESYVLMGDYVALALKSAADFGFPRIHLAAQWGKLIKIAMGSTHTHVRFGQLDLQKAVTFLHHLGINFGSKSPGTFHTAREIFTLLDRQEPEERAVYFRLLSRAAKQQAELLAGGRSAVSVHLVSYEGMIIADSH